MNSSELRSKSLEIANQARALLDTITDENRAEKESEFDRMMADSDSFANRAAQLDKIEEREREFGAAETRAPAETVTVEGRANTEANDETRAKAIEQYLRGEISDRELRAQSVGTASEGGYLVPDAPMAGLVVSMKAFGPMNEGGPATWYVTTGGNPLPIPTLNDTANTGAALAENTAASDVDLTFGQKQLDAYKFTSGVFKVSSELLADSAIPVTEIVNAAMAERLGRSLNAALTTGTGSGQAEGIVTGSSLGVTGASASAIAADELHNLVASLDPAYRIGAGFMAHDNIRLAIRKLKDDNNQYLWVPGLQAGDAEKLLGYPLYINQGMASSMVANNKTILFGDFKKFYARRAGPLVIRRLNERYGEADQVGFVGFVRVDGVVADAGAIKHFKQAAS